MTMMKMSKAPSPFGLAWLKKIFVLGVCVFHFKIAYLRIHCRDTRRRYRVFSFSSFRIFSEFAFKPYTFNEQLAASEHALRYISLRKPSFTFTSWPFTFSVV